MVEDRSDHEILKGVIVENEIFIDGVAGNTFGHGTHIAGFIRAREPVVY